MEIQTQFTNAGLLVSLRGVLDEAAAGAIQQRLQAVIWRNRSYLLLDFKEVSKVTAPGLRSLLPSVQQVQENNRELVVFHLNAPTLALFQNSGFDTLVTIVDSLETANTYIAQRYNSKRK